MHSMIRSISRVFSGHSETKSLVVFNCSFAQFSSLAESRKTCLYDFHLRHGAKMVPFAGWAMPVQYADQSLIESHLHTRKHVSIFDVSHMLQTRIHGKDRMKFFESLVTADVQNLAENHASLTIYTNEAGGIKDDLIVSNTPDGFLYVVSNAACAEKDLAHIRSAASNAKLDVTISPLDDQGLLAVQGPEMVQLLQPGIDFDLNHLGFMTGRGNVTVFGIKGCRITRCGYTGEDGVEISVAPNETEKLCEKLLSSKNAKVKLAGLGARDSLRLEAGLCLYGNDMDEKSTPIEAALGWLIAKRRRETGGFPGAAKILAQIKDAKSVSRKRVGIITEKGRPPRAGAVIFDASGSKKLGLMTSGCPSPSLKVNVGMGYVPPEQSKNGTKLRIDVSGGKTAAQFVDGEIVKMPFVPTRYFVLKK